MQFDRVNAMRGQVRVTTPEQTFGCGSSLVIRRRRQPIPATRAYAINIPSIDMSPHPGIDTNRIKEKARKDLLDLIEGVCRRDQSH